MSTLAHMMKVTPSCLWRYFRKDGLPYFDYLLHLCYTLSISPLEFLTERSLPSQGFLHSPVIDLTALSRGKGKWVTKDDVQHMRLVLETLLAREEVVPYPSLKEIAQWVGCGVETLRNHCPDLCRASTKRYKRQWTEDNVRIRMRQALESGLASNEPLSLMAIARQIDCDTSSLRKYFPDLCQAIVTRYRERFDYERIQQRLQEVLTSNEEVPSVYELAKQMGYRVDIIWVHFTDQCKQISARRLAQQRKQHEERMVAICEQIRQVMLILHDQGIYPSARQVFVRLNDRHILRTIEGHEAWRLMLEELGYPTDKIKRYD